VGGGVRTRRHFLLRQNISFPTNTIQEIAYL
jgi:hypothetical protein